MDVEGLGKASFVDLEAAVEELNLEGAEVADGLAVTDEDVVSGVEGSFENLGSAMVGNGGVEHVHVDETLEEVGVALGVGVEKLECAAGSPFAHRLLHSLQSQLLGQVLDRPSLPASDISFDH